MNSATIVAKLMFYGYSAFTDQQEIDLIEAQGKKVLAFETKWGMAKVKLPAAFAKAYPATPFNVINRENYLDWIS